MGDAFDAVPLSGLYHAMVVLVDGQVWDWEIRLNYRPSIQGRRAITVEGAAVTFEEASGTAAEMDRWTMALPWHPLAAGVRPYPALGAVPDPVGLGNGHPDAAGHGPHLGQRGAS